MFAVLDIVVDMPVASNDRCLGLSVQKNCGIRSCSADIVVDVPVCAGRRLGLLLEMPQTQFSARVRGSFQCAPRQGGIQRGFGGDVGLGIFRAPLGRPELSASFRSSRLLPISS